MNQPINVVINQSKLLRTSNSPLPKLRYTMNDKIHVDCTEKKTKDIFNALANTRDYEDR